MTQAVDSIAGSISGTYDGLGDLLSETTAPGSITYQYDLTRRRTSMQVAGQNPVTYSWANDNRLQSITQSGTLGNTSVAFTYDDAHRRQTLTLPNGIVLSYAYDNGSRITGMSWMLGVNQVGDLEYSYDADGHVTEKTGSLASTGIPASVSGNTFNAANEMTAFNGSAQTYDLNGNLLTDGTNTYTWDARNHLSTLTGSGTPATSASFVYDALGRRTAKNINNQVTYFLYDRWNSVQELTSAGGQFLPTANMLTGLAIDEFFQRSDVNGAQSFVTDQLQSTLALTNSLGSITTSYTYEPFGNVTISPSQTNTNPYQFTGREDDGTGLYYYRARYYSPTDQRFLSQDPLDYIGGGSDLYNYVLNDPASAVDRDGLKVTDCKKGDCPPSVPSGGLWTPDSKIPGLPRWIRQNVTHSGETCYEAIVNGRYLHCCYDQNGNPVYGPGGSAWEDYPPTSLGHLVGGVVVSLLPLPLLESQQYRRERCKYVGADGEEFANVAYRAIARYRRFVVLVVLPLS